MSVSFTGRTYRRRRRRPVIHVGRIQTADWRKRADCVWWHDLRVEATCWWSPESRAPVWEDRWTNHSAVPELFSTLYLIQPTTISLIDLQYAVWSTSVAVNLKDEMADAKEPGDLVQFMSVSVYALVQFSMPCDIQICVYSSLQMVMERGVIIAYVDIKKFSRGSRM